MNIWETIAMNASTHLAPSLLSRAKAEALQLEEFRAFDFTSIPSELAKVFPKTHERIRGRYAAFTYRASVDGAPQYVDDPDRLLEVGVGPVADTVRELYRQLDVNGVLLDAEQACVGGQAYILAVLPTPDGGLRLTRFLPFQVVRVVHTDPLATELADADEVTLSIPMAKTDESGVLVTAWHAHLVFTRETAYLRLPDGARKGVFNDGQTNPLGRVPLVGTRRAKPVHGWLPEAAQDILSAQLGLVLALSDVEYIVRKQSHVKVLVTGEDTDKLPVEIEDRPDGMIPLPEGTAATGLTLQPPIEKYLRAAETGVYYTSSFRYLRPDPYQASIVTGAARREEAAGYYEERRRHERRLRRLEQDLLELVVAVYNLLPRALKLPVDLRWKSVEYRYIRTPENALQEAQARAVLLGEGLADRVREVAKEERVDEDEARKILNRRLEDLASFLRAKSAAGAPLATPGLDKLDNAVPAP